jgi:hypothetical protein
LAAIDNPNPTVTKSFRGEWGGELGMQSIAPTRKNHVSDQRGGF